MAVGFNALIDVMLSQNRHALYHGTIQRWWVTPVDMDSQEPACLPSSSLTCSRLKNTNDRRRKMESKASSETYSRLTAGFRRLELRGAMIHHPTPVLMSLLPAHRLQQTSQVRIPSSSRTHLNPLFVLQVQVSALTMPVFIFNTSS